MSHKKNKNSNINHYGGIKLASSLNKIKLLALPVVRKKKLKHCVNLDFYLQELVVSECFQTRDPLSAHLGFCRSDKSTGQHPFSFLYVLNIY